MLTDYHLHLRPDERPSTPEQYFTGANADRYRQAATARGVTELGVSEHIHRFEQALEVWQHPFWKFSATDDVDAYCAFVREETDLRLGIEADFIPGREDQLANFLESREWDYVVGSVHFLADRGVDAEYSETGGNWDVWRGVSRADEVWKRYFDTLAEAARSGLYDILAHPDLVKVWGRARPVPESDPRFFYEPAIEAIAESGIVVEISTAGLRKPVGEIYPARAFLEMVADAGNPIALSSDAHCPQHIGYGYAEALTLLREVGIKELTVFEGRERRAVPIEDADVEIAHRHAAEPPTNPSSGRGRPGA